MRGGRASRFTVYDMMEEKGIFEENDANATSSKYKGPIEYPKMLYHPEGKTRITQKAEILNTPMGPLKVGEQEELIWRAVEDREEEDKYKTLGWHDHPSKAIAASGKEAPPMAADGKIGELEGQIARLKAELLAAQIDLRAKEKESV